MKSSTSLRRWLQLQSGPIYQMPQVIFQDSAGISHLVECEIGQSLMRAALNAGVPGIVAECGGCMTCGTCHVHFKPEIYDQLPPPSPDEVVMLDMLVDRDRTSRLSCQIRMTADLAGIAVRVSEQNG